MTRTTHRSARILARIFAATVVATAAIGVVGCTTSTAPVGGSRPRSEPTPLYVALGNGETAGNGTRSPREAWPHVLFREALPRRWALVNLGTTGATTVDVLGNQVDAALALGPTLATVAITDDLFAGVTPADFGRRLTEIVRRLRRNGATRVLVANVPPLDRQPGYLACLPDRPVGSAPCSIREPVQSPADLDAAVDAFNQQIARVATAERATLVDLHAAGLAARAKGEEAARYAGNDFSPNAAGHRAIAAVFAGALRRPG